MRRALLLGILVAAVAAWWQSPFSLKLRVAIDLLGWDGLAVIAQQAIAQRLLGHRRTKSRAAWHRLIKTLHDVELQYLVPQRRVTDAETVAEGDRFIAHALRFALSLVESDLDRPRFEEMVHPSQKVLGDNPDAKYFNAYVNREGSFKVTGKRVGEVYLSFTVYESPCVGCFSNLVVADVNDRAIEFQPDGSYELYVSPTRPPEAKNWLSLANVSRDGFPQLITRHYFESVVSAQLDPAVHPIIAIAPTQPRGPPPAKGPAMDELIASRFERVEAFMTSHTVGMPQDPAAAPAWFSFSPNTFGPPVLFRGANGGQLGAVDIAYSAGPWKLDPGTQALLITGVMPPCVFANVMLWNVFLQTLPYEAGRQVSLNRKQMKSLRLDGSFTLLLSRLPPRRADVDWLDLEERATGSIFFRFLLPEGNVSTPDARLVALSEWTAAAAAPPL